MDSSRIAETVPGGAMRETTHGRGRFDLLCFSAIARVALVAEAGAEKYAANNWRKGMPSARFVDSTLRHLFQWLLGDRDEDHLAAAIWNLAALIEQEERIEAGHLPAELAWRPIDV